MKMLFYSAIILAILSATSCTPRFISYCEHTNRGFKLCHTAGVHSSMKNGMSLDWVREDILERSAIPGKSELSDDCVYLKDSVINRRWDLDNEDNNVELIMFDGGYLLTFSDDEWYQRLFYVFKSEHYWCVRALQKIESRDWEVFQ
jgi:hypothetical protein